MSASLPDAHIQPQSYKISQEAAKGTVAVRVVDRPTLASPGGARETLDMENGAVEVSQGHHMRDLRVHG